MAYLARKAASLASNVDVETVRQKKINAVITFTPSIKGIEGKKA